MKKFNTIWIEKNISITYIVTFNPKNESLSSGNARSKGVIKLDSKRAKVIVISITL
jgi:hypothetical protein